MIGHLSVYHVSNVWFDVCNSGLVQLQSTEVSRTVTNIFEWNWMITVNEGTQDPEYWTQYSSFVSALSTVYAQ